MATVNIQLNTVDAVDFSNVDGRNALVRETNLLVGAASGTGPRCSSAILSVTPNSELLVRTPVTPLIMPIAGTNVSISTGFVEYLDNPTSMNFGVGSYATSYTQIIKVNL